MGEGEIKNLSLTKESAHFKIESNPFNFLFAGLDLEDIVNLLRIISESDNDARYLRFNCKGLETENMKLKQEVEDLEEELCMVLDNDFLVVLLALN